VIGAPDDLLLHELKAPLAVISGYAQLLELRGDERTRLEAARRIREAVERLEEMFDDLVALAAPARERATAGSAGSIVIVDDDPLIRGLLRATLDTGEHAVADWPGSVDALAAIEPEPRLVLLDWRMPGRDGSELLVELKRAHPDLPVVVLTGDARERERALSLGADRFLTKPFSTSHLLAVIDEITAA
jgi:CheY-like chemotaxis protein